MSNIRSKWTSQELKIHNYLKSYKVKHCMHPKISGSPDILIKDTNLAIFLHGCFWHKCSKCYKKPKSNRKFWNLKIEKNVARDRRNKDLLKKKGCRVKHFWEHDVKKDPGSVVIKIIGLNEKFKGNA